MSPNASWVKPHRSRWLALAQLFLATLLFAVAGGADATTPTYTANYTWDANRRVVFVISADPGTGVRPATKTTYNLDGQVTQIDKGTTTTATGSDFTSQERIVNTYDAAGNVSVVQSVDVAASTTLALTQNTYDPNDRLTCAAIRINPASFASLPANGCTLGTSSSNGADRITRATYDAAGQALVKTEAYATANQRNYATYTYNLNGKLVTEKDASGNLTTLEYDGFDRVAKMDLPSATLSAGTSDTSNYEAYTYDTNDNRLNLRKRDGRFISWCYDALNREVKKYLSGSETASPGVACTLNVTTGAVSGPTLTASDVATAYDLLSRKSSATFASGLSVAYTYDKASRLLTEATGSQTLSYQYDSTGNRTRVTWPDAIYVTYAYDALNHLTQVSDSASNNLATPAYDGLGRRTSIARGNGTSTSFAFDKLDRLTSLGQDLPGTANDLTLSFAYNPASQILSRGVSNTAYDWALPSQQTVNKAYDGLNRDAAIVAASGYDLNGNLTSDGSRTFTYDVENHLLGASAPTAITLSYDPLGRLQQTVAGSTTTAFLYSGDQLVAEYSGSTLLRRYVHGAGTDEPLYWYEGSGTTDRRSLHADNQGSIVAASGSTVATFTYGAYGEPGGNNWTGSRFRYTGQIAIPEAQLYYYKARVYDPGTGRFLQTDPAGYDGGLDLYEYAEDDPIDKLDHDGRRVEWVFQPGTRGMEARAQNYLMHSPHYAANFQRLESSRATYAIVVGRSGRDQDYDFRSRTIHVDPTQGMRLRDGSVQSAAVGGQAHEVDHAAQHDKIGTEAFRDSLAIPLTPGGFNSSGEFVVNQGTSHEEERATRSTDNVARDLGEPTRGTYHNAAGSQQMPTSTSHVCTGSWIPTDNPC